MRELLTDRVILVTGATQGLGLAIAEAAAAEGAAGVALVGRDPEKARRAVEAVERAGSGRVKAHAILSDLAMPGAAEDAVSAAIGRFGRVDSLVNAAGLTTRGTLLDSTRQLLDEHVAVNLAAPFMTMQGVVRHLRERGEPGTIVNILSMSMHGGQPFLAAYVASKAALAALTRNAAFAHRRDRIRINGLNIGWTATPGEAETQRRFHGAGDDWLATADASQPMGRLGRPDEIADAVVFLLSDRSGVVTGSIIDWDQTVPGAYDG